MKKKFKVYAIKTEGNYLYINDEKLIPVIYSTRNEAEEDLEWCEEPCEIVIMCLSLKEAKDDILRSRKDYVQDA